MLHSINKNHVYKYTIQTTNICMIMNNNNSGNRNMFLIFQQMTKEQAAKHELKVNLDKLKLTALNDIFQGEKQYCIDNKIQWNHRIKQKYNISISIDLIAPDDTNKSCEFYINLLQCFL